MDIIHDTNFQAMTNGQVRKVIRGLKEEIKDARTLCQKAWIALKSATSPEDRTRLHGTVVDLSLLCESKRMQIDALAAWQCRSKRPAELTKQAN
jgi:hypothetical protein